jgi:hypothetical protein
VSEAFRTALFACLVAGPALWLSRASLDRVGTGAGTRVAFLPSLPELAGLTVTVGLLLLLAGALILRLLRRRDPEAVLDARGLWPLGILALLAVPYLPWLPDAIPALDALAGPGRWWLWGVVLGLSIWATAGDRVRLSPSRWRTLLVLVLSAALYVATAWRLSPSPLFPAGDEPHYLVITQSLLSDGDLAIENNHLRRDYRVYYAGDLKPDVIAHGRDDVIYSIHPIGLPLLVAPAFAFGGYRAASLTVAACAALAMGLLWHLVQRSTGSASAATVGWLAIATSVPWLLHSFALYPEVPAALATLVAVGWRPRRETTALAIINGFALAALPWLGTKYAPMSAVVVLLLMTRPGTSAGYRAAIATPWLASVAAWLGWFFWLWGSPWPSAPYGGEHQMAAGNLVAGLPGVLFDQEYGAIAYTPVLAAAFIGWWRLWRQPDRRRLALESLLPFLALLLTVASYAMFWGGSAPPGRQIVAALPLLSFPIAHLYLAVKAHPVRRALLVLLLLVGMCVSATLVYASNGLLIANGRDGAAQWLAYLSPAGELVRLVPSFVRGRAEPWPAIVGLALWALAATAVWHLAGRLGAMHRGAAALVSTALVAAGLLALAISIPALARPLPPLLPVEARAVVPGLMRYDATARPWGIDYRPFHLAPPEALLDLFVLEGRPGLRRSPQPLHVLLNTRLALPPGRYRVSIQPRPGRAIDGTVGLQVGRMGAPFATWSLDAPPGGEWSHDFDLDLESSFVGVRASPEIEAAVQAVRVSPIRVDNAGRRAKRPTVVAATHYAGEPFYFHGDTAYVESAGFWVRGGRRLDATVVIQPGLEPPGLKLKLHSGTGNADVTVRTTHWSTVLRLSPGTPTTILVPAHPQQRLLPLSIAPDRGFVPAEHGGAPDDHRLLGCWVEVLSR